MARVFGRCRGFLGFRQVATSNIGCDIVQNGGYGNSTRNLAGLVSPHTIGKDYQTIPDIRNSAVLIMRASLSDIRHVYNFKVECEGHAISHWLEIIHIG